MATNPIESPDQLTQAIRRARRAAAAAGELHPPKIGAYRSPLGDEEQAAVLDLLRSGAYARAAAAVAASDDDLADR